MPLAGWQSLLSKTTKTSYERFRRWGLLAPFLFYPHAEQIAISCKSVSNLLPLFLQALFKKLIERQTLGSAGPNLCLAYFVEDCGIAHLIGTQKFTALLPGGKPKHGPFQTLDGFRSPQKMFEIENEINLFHERGRLFNDALFVPNVMPWLWLPGQSKGM